MPHPHRIHRRTFLRAAAATTGALLLPQHARSQMQMQHMHAPATQPATSPGADHSLRIAPGIIELSPDKIAATTLYNNQFPGPHLRFKQNRPVTIDIHNDTDRPEQLHWHGLFLPTDVDGSAEEGTPFIPPHASRRITITPTPAGFRWYHSHTMGQKDLSIGLYTGQIGTVYIEPQNNAGNYDQEHFLVLKEFLPNFSRNAEMQSDVLTPTDQLEELLQLVPPTHGKMNMTGAMGMGVLYHAFGINGRMLGAADPIRVRQNQRLLLHILNASATDVRSLHLPNHTFKVLALDGNPVPSPAEVPVLWLGPGERISCSVDMKSPGIWILGETADYERTHGLGTVIAYAGLSGKPQWIKPAAYQRWDYTRFSNPADLKDHKPSQPEETLTTLFAEGQMTDDGFNVWTINGHPFDMDNMAPLFTLKQGRRYRWKIRNASDDVHPVHLHRHSFELTKFHGRPTAGILKDVIMVGPYQEVEVDFTADQPGLSLMHCHMQIHMDYGFMALFNTV